MDLGPGANSPPFGPIFGELCVEADLNITLELNGDVFPNREMPKANRHVRFTTDDSDLSDFSDSIEVLGEEQEHMTLQKVKQRHKKKLVRGPSPNCYN